MGQTVVKTGAQALSGSTLVYSSAVAQTLDPMYFQPPMHTNKGYSITIVLSSGTAPTLPFEITTF